MTTNQQRELNKSLKIVMNEYKKMYKPGTRVTIKSTGKSGVVESIKMMARPMIGVIMDDGGFAVTTGAEVSIIV